MRGTVLGSLALLVIIPWTAVSPAWADVVELKTGQRVEGNFEGADRTSVRVEVGGQVITFKPEQVRAIYYSAAPAAALSSTATPAAEALRALKALQSATNAGVTYRDYGPRVADAKAPVDRYLHSSDAQDPGRAAIERAMATYVLVARAWSASITKAVSQYAPIGRDPLVESCPAVEAATRQMGLKVNEATTATNVMTMLAALDRLEDDVPVSDRVFTPLWEELSEFCHANSSSRFTSGGERKVGREIHFDERPKLNAACMRLVVGATLLSQEVMFSWRLECLQLIEDLPGDR